MPQTPDDSQLDVVQHPTLGTLKFPKSMHMDERNASIDRLMASPQANLPGGTPRLTEAARGLPTSLTQPSSFERDRTTGPRGLLNGVRNWAQAQAEGAVNPPEQDEGRPLGGHTIPGLADAPLAGSREFLRARGAGPTIGGSHDAYGAAAVANMPLGVSAQRMEHAADRADPGGVIGEGAVPAGSAVAGYLAPKAWSATSGARGALARKLVQPLVYEGVGEAAGDTRLGIEPDRGIVREGIWGTRKSMARQAGERLSELKPAADSVLQNSPGSTQTIDAAKHINAAVDEAIQNARAQGSPEMIPRLENLRTALLTEHGPTSGSPFDINNVKTSIQNVASRLGAYKNTVPAEASAGNTAGRAAFGIKNDVNAAVPEGMLPNERMADLIDAQSGLNRGIEAQKGKDVFSGDLWGLPNKLIQRTVASPLVRSGLARALTLGDKLSVPPVMPKPLPPQTALFPGESEAPTPSPPPDPAAQVGQPPTLGFPPTMPDTMWTPRATPSAPTWSLPDRSQPFTTPSSRGSALTPPSPPVVPSPQGGAPPSGNTPAPTGSAPPSSSAPPTLPLPPMPSPAPLNPQELIDFTNTLRSEGYTGPVTEDNIYQLMRQANEMRTNQQMAAGRPDAVSATRETHRATLEKKAPR